MCAAMPAWLSGVLEHEPGRAAVSLSMSHLLAPQPAGLHLPASASKVPTEDVCRQMGAVVLRFTDNSAKIFFFLLQKEEKKQCN